MESSDLQDALGLIAVPFLVAAFACSAIGSFVIWRVRIAAAAGAKYVPLDMHHLHDGESDKKLAILACGIGLLAFALPVSLFVQFAG